MANTSSPHGRGGGSRRRCVAITRGDLLTILVAAALCSASYCLAIWHNSRGAAGGSLLGSSPGVRPFSVSCDGGGGVDEPLDFVAHHTAESAGLSVSSSAAVTTARRALRGDAARSKVYHGAGMRPGAFPPPASRDVAWAAAGKSWAARFDGDSVRFTSAGAIRA